MAYPPRCFCRSLKGPLEAFGVSILVGGHGRRSKERRKLKLRKFDKTKGGGRRAPIEMTKEETKEESLDTVTAFICHSNESGGKEETKERLIKDPKCKFMLAQPSETVNNVKNVYRQPNVEIASHTR